MRYRVTMLSFGLNCRIGSVAHSKHAPIAKNIVRNISYNTITSLFYDKTTRLSYLQGAEMIESVCSFLARLTDL
jgi:hypothetical protein